MTKASWRFKGFVAVVGGLGMVLTIANSFNLLESFSYFTTQMNALATVLFACLAWFGMRGVTIDCRVLTVFKGAMTLALLVTMLVYHLVLRPVLSELYVDYAVWGVQDLIVHYAMPLLVLLDWGLFDVRGTVRRTDPLWFLLVPLTYVLYVIVYGALGGRFATQDIMARVPYFFLDVETYGLGTVVFWSALVLLVFFLLGVALYWFDRGMDRRSNPPGP
ncbi:MAG: hypothetical protein EA374_05475 [Acholeplasmatales bacterium]|nr:MAG: hypothetical protein EA374_05475 [Acholeplasmatales bacterium]